MDKLPPAIRPNWSKHKLLAGEPVFCPVPVTDLASLENLAALSLLDLAMLDMEHGPWAWRDISDFSRLCDLWRISSMVRVAANDEVLIGKALDLGAQSILVPHVLSADDAARAVRAARYAPAGTRGMGGPRQGLGVADYWKSADREVMVGVLIEDVEALSQLELIAAVPGVDFVFLAPFDLASSLGHVGEPFSPDVQGEVRTAIKKLSSMGKSCGTFVTDDCVEEYLSLGARLLFFSPAVYLYKGISQFRNVVSRALDGFTQPSGV
ncbi:HpcH/HpaI aldolase family protein [Sphingopyxis flava]|uniref:2,4-dihydroxyhept-2-enedioate aldolase n=1 Tax=Sphingopyxis flava TaxID=1507287 RepID=A0A1T5GN76_9SPHN|nr:aldolase/citrate lyase family protein [Sphingopyxis flava]SKC09853.1 2,4-dihydroxyhept-2-enedioate aldolase [Sphingopyxis flava]